MQTATELGQRFPNCLAGRKRRLKHYYHLFERSFRAWNFLKNAARPFKININILGKSLRTSGMKVDTRFFIHFQYVSFFCFRYAFSESEKNF